MAAALAQWGLRLSQRTTLSDAAHPRLRGKAPAPRHPDRRVGRERHSGGLWSGYLRIKLLRG